MSITCVKLEELLLQPAFCSSRIGTNLRSAETAHYRTGVILIEPCQSTRDRLISIIESEWQVKVIALASVEEWLKLRNYVPADLILLSDVELRTEAKRSHKTLNLEALKHGVPIYFISIERTDLALSATHTTGTQPIFEEYTMN